VKRIGPLLTLAAGVVVAAVLMVLNINANHRATQPAADAVAAPATISPTAAPTTAAPTTAAPTTAPTTAAPTTAVPAGPPVTYAGAVAGGASIAIAVKDGQAIAYLCDGATAEAWLQGTARNGQLSLTGSENASLTGTYGNGVAQGTVTAVGRDWSFSVGKVDAPSGLYRAATTVANATVVGGWIVLADGTEVGTQRKGGTVSPASRLNLTDRSALLDGVAVTAERIDGTRL
jgi:hypothetical protein